MKPAIELYKELAPFLKNVASSFEIELSGGAYLRFANSGKRGEAKWFNLGLAEILTTLRDISAHSKAFASAESYDEKTWRDLGSQHFSDEAARSFITVQTKPVFTILSKIIHWATGSNSASYSDSQIDLSSAALKKTIETIENMVSGLAPDAIAGQLNIEPPKDSANPSSSDLRNFREDFSAAISQARFINVN